MTTTTTKPITVAEAVARAAASGVEVQAQWIRKLLQRGDIAGNNVGGRVWMVDVESLDVWIRDAARHRPGPKPRADGAE